MKQLTKYGVRTVYSAGIFLTANTVLAGALWPEMGELWRAAAAAVFFWPIFFPPLPTGAFQRPDSGAAGMAVSC